MFRRSADQKSAALRTRRSEKQLEAVLRGSTENQNIGDRLMWTVANVLLEEIGVGTSYRFQHWDRGFGAVPNLATVDAVFDLGNVYYCDSWPQPVTDRIRRSIEFNRSFRTASIVYLPCGWGPYKPEDRPIVDRLTRGAIVFARDPISLDYLNEAVGSERAIFCPDLALICQPEQPDAAQNLLRELGISIESPLLGLIPNQRCVENGVTPLADPLTYRCHLERVVQWSRQNDYQVLGIPHMVDTDRDRRLLEGLGVPVIDCNEPSIIRSVIANLTVAVCSRYHGLVNCLVHAVPTVSLGWQHKYRGLMRYFELAELDHPLDDSSERLCERLDLLSTSRDRFSTHIFHKMLQAREEIRNAMAGLSQQLGGPATVLSEPVKFENMPIETVSHIRATPTVRMLRRLRRFVAA